MKHLHTFSQHLNESALLNLPDGVSKMDNKTYVDLERRLGRENLGEPFTEEEKKKLDGVRQLLRFEKYPRENDYEFVMVREWSLNAVGNAGYSPPAAWLKKMRQGTYAMAIVFEDGYKNPTKYHTSKSLDQIILCVNDLVDTEIEWIEIG
jgi:hypothetical protein